MFEIEKVIDELKKSNPNGFVIESHLQVEFGYALKRAYKDANPVIFEWTNKTGRADMIATVSGETIAFEFKYFTRPKQIKLNDGLEVMLKDQVARDIPRTGVWKDVEKIEQLIASENNIVKGYCLLITNDKDLFISPKKTNLDFDFDLANGPRPLKHDLKKISKKNTVIQQNHINGTYHLVNKEYNADFRYLVIEIK